MDMKNKEQVLYFFLQGKISLSQYDYKFMANLQTMIQNQNRVTSNQATLFDNLISKYKKQLAKQGLDKDELKALTWKTELVDSTDEYTGATITINGDSIRIRVPFNKSFISAFRNTENNKFEWDKELKQYVAPFSTASFRVAATFPKAFFPSMKLCSQAETLLTEINKYKAEFWKPTLTKRSGTLMIAATNPVLAEQLLDIDLSISPAALFKLSNMGITVDNELVESDANLMFSANRVYEAEITDVEQIIGWMKNIGCENVVIGRGLRNSINLDQLVNWIEKYDMKPVGPMSFGRIPDGVSMLLQHTSSTELRNAFKGNISKTVVLRDSRPVEVK